MDIAITGASGLIGSALTHSLELAGHRVLPVVRRNPTGDQIGWDPAKGTIDAAGFEGISGVVHLAGEPIGGGRWNEARKAAIRDSRVDGTRLLAETLAGLDKPPTAFVSGSAMGIYGDTGQTAVTESGPNGSSFLAKVTIDWEAAAQPAIDAGIRVTFPRTGIVLSPDGGALEKMLPLFKLALGGRLGSGKQYWSWISIDDMVGVLRFLLDNDVSGPFNATAPEPVTNTEFTKTLAKVVGRPALFPVPSFGPKLLLGGELADELLFTSARVLPAALEAAGYSFRHRTLEAALRAVLTAPEEVA